MEPFRMRFVFGKLTDEELQSLQQGESVIRKMLLTPDDFQAFHYRESDEIEAETQDGNRVWTTIKNIESIDDKERVIVILTLSQKPTIKRSNDNGKAH